MILIKKFQTFPIRIQLILAISLLGVIHHLFNMVLPLHPDEAYYWLWSTQIDWSYYDHPGFIAWMIRLLSFMGDGEAGVRFANVVSMSVTAYVLSMLAYKMTGEKAAWLVLLIFAVLPATSMGYVFVTPDSPLIMFWAMALYFGYIAIFEGKKSYFIWTGVSIALMITSKYTAILFPASLFVYMLIYDRRLFKEKYTWIACAIAMLGVLPIVIWNYKHEWISIAFQYTHGTSSGLQIEWVEFILFALGIQLLPTPIFAFLIYKATIKFPEMKGDKGWGYLKMFFLVPLIFFLYKGLFKKMELNWAIIAYISAIVMLGIYAAKGYHKKLFKAGWIFSLVLTAFLLLSPFLPLPDNINISLRLKGYKEAVEALKPYIQEGDHFFSDHLTTASEIVYYIDGHPRVMIPVKSRYSQFDIWDNGTDFSTMSGLYLGRNNAGEELESVFGKAELLEIVATGSPTRPRHFYIYRVGEE